MRSGPSPLPVRARALAAVTQPALRPMASMTDTWMGRLRTSWLISLVMPAMNRAAEPKPGAWSVTAMSLSTVLGMPTTRTSTPAATQALNSLPQASMLPLPPLNSTQRMLCLRQISAMAA